MTAWRDANDQAGQWLEALTTDEKCRLLAGDGLWRTHAIPRLGITSLGMTDGPMGVAFHSSGKRCTAFPAPIALAASWDRQLAAELGAAMGSETRAAGKQVLLAPGINLQRSPLNGRHFEYFSEDPLLTSSLAVPLVQGIQGQGVAACLKHFACNNQETNRMRVDVRVSEEALETLYLPAFQRGVQEGDAWSVMASYNRINGEHGCEQRDLLSRLRDWGFQGFVVSDWFAARGTHDSASCLKAGLNLEMPGKGRRYGSKPLLAALAAGSVTEAEIDAALVPLLRVVARVQRAQAQRPVPRIDRAAHHALGRRLGAAGMVLLKNDAGLLPLAAERLTRIAVIGPNANRRHHWSLWGGSSAVWPRGEVTPLKGLRKALGARVRIVRDPAKADMAVVVVGLNHRPGQDCEHFDRKDLTLPKGQDALVEATLAANPNTVVVIVGGGPVAMPWLDRAPAVLVAWYGGQAAGDALADVLLGHSEPGGRLPVSWPAALADLPAHASARRFPGEAEVHYEEGLAVGYRHFLNSSAAPLFPFGFGLGYSQFALTGVAVTSTAQGLACRGMVTNTGAREGSTVLQLYGQPEGGTPSLLAYTKLVLTPGETRELEWVVASDALRRYEPATGLWQPWRGPCRFWLGQSSADQDQMASIAL